MTDSCDTLDAPAALDYDVLVVGAGIGGTESALKLGDMGQATTAGSSAARSSRWLPLRRSGIRTGPIFRCRPGVTGRPAALFADGG